MSDEQRLRVVLCWHMHQPDYRDPVSGEYRAPWSYLHGIKDYTDMAAHLEDAGGASAVVNFSPVLLEQIEDYRIQLQEYLGGRAKLRDPLLAALAEPEPAAGAEAIRKLLRTCLTLAGPRMHERSPRLNQLAARAADALADADAGRQWDARSTADFVVWCHLAWLGESVRRSDARAQRLLQQSENYTAADRHELLQLMQESLAGILPRYRALADSGRVELSLNPYAHPLMPLLLDFGSAREAQPELHLPGGNYPGGAARLRWHLEQARRSHARHFRRDAAGCWPSEGAVSAAVLALLEESGFAWAASGQRVLMHSLGIAQGSSEVLHRPYRLAGQKLVIFFRDDILSDLIGFEYRSWQADHAVADLVTRLAAMAAEAEAGPGRVVSIVLDGENAWEHYPDNGFDFLRALYRALSHDPRFRLTTFSQCAADAGVPIRTLPRLVAGSWVRGTLDTWVGHPNKNRAWDALVEARRHCDAALAEGRLDARQRERLERQLAVCEGSDWFWWPGDDNPASAVAQFERLYRMQLEGLYRLIGEVPPADLARPLSRGKLEPAGGGAMLPAQ